jgi:arylsulfatase A-like enzyme/Flp pilus assembly protein TadD
VNECSSTRAFLAILTVLLATPILACDPAGNRSEANLPPVGSAARADASPNVLLVTLDTTRADRLGAYGYEPASTPTLDGLAAAGVLFEQAYSPAPQTLPAHATMLTGREPPEHGARVNGKHTLGEGIPTLAEVLSERGYRTGAFVAAFVLDSKFGLDRGFEVYDDDLSGAYEQEVPEALSTYRAGNVVVDSALAWLGEMAGSSSDRPFFAWVHLYDPHWAYHPHSELAGTPFQGQTSYDAEIAFVDLQVSRLLAFLDERGLTSETVVLAVADHGEGLEDHAEIEHGYLLNEEVLRVPWIVAWPGALQAGHRVGAMVSLVDLFPTVLDLLGADPPEGIRGRSLAPALRGDVIESLPSYAETDLPYTSFGWSPMRSLTTEQWKYVRTPRRELFDRTTDRGELFNLASARPRELDEMDAQLAELEATFSVTESSQAILTTEERARLASLGYLTGDAPEPTDDRELRDMKEMIPTKALAGRLRAGMVKGTMDDEEILEVARALVEQSPETALFHQHLGVALAAKGELEPAIAQFSEAARLDPGSAEAQYHLGDALWRQGRPDEAVARFRKSLELDPDYAPPHVGMGNVLGDRGQLDVAAGHYAEAIRLRPQYVEAHYNLANVLARRRRPVLARKHYEIALAERPEFTPAHYSLGNLLLEQRDLDGAIEHYRATVEQNPEHFDALNNLGVALADSGRGEEAEVHYREALRINPDFARPQMNLGNLYAKRGEYGRAIEHYEEVVRLWPQAPEPANVLARILASCPDDEYRDASRAITLAERAAELSKRRNARVLDTLGAAYAEAGRYDEALVVASRALRLAQSRNADQLAAEIEEHLRLYTSAQPLRQSARP